MGGSSKKQTIGYWYNWAMCFGWCKGPVDALLEFRAGDKTAWQGRMTSSGSISIYKPNLWGGEDNTSGGTGGVVGVMDVMFGEADQAPNDYLIGTFGAQQSGRRGKFCTTFRGGKFGAFVANPKPVSAKIERILADWQDDTPWYPEKAIIGPTNGGSVVPEVLSIDASTASVDPSPGVTFDVDVTDKLTIQFAAGLAFGAWSRWPADDAPGVPPEGAWWCKFSVKTATGVVTTYLGDSYLTEAAALDAAIAAGPIVLTGSTSYTIWLPDDILDNRGGLSLQMHRSGALNAMNPAHILYDSLTHGDLQGEPVGAISDESFRAAADKLFNEGFGICTDYDGSQETPLQFQQRICNVIGASLSQSRVDGLYYLDLIRGDYDLDSLPIIGEDDIISFSQDPSVITETGNKLSVEWFDPLAKESRTTPPVYSMGNIRSAGRVIPAETKKYPEIPMESLALRVAMRDLKSTAVPLSKFDLTTRATQRGLRPGMNVRLQVPSEGIADMVVVTGSVAHGTATKGDMKIVAVQNVYSMPSTVYVNPQDGLWVPPDSTPVPSPHQVAIEAPYVEVVAHLSAADLAVLPADAGFLLVAASKPASATNYLLTTAAAGEEYAEHGFGDWCPTATINEAAAELDTAFTVAGASLIDRVAVGAWALWDSEIVRVDAIDVDAGTLDLGRGCADTAPGRHDADSRIYFCGEWGSTDQREYVGGDVVGAKLLTRINANQLDPDDAPIISVTMDDRQSRPYPPGNLQVNGAAYPTAITGACVLTWAHRDRLSQADQLIDTLQGDVGPEPGVTYTIKVYLDGVLDSTTTGITGTTATPTISGAGTARVDIFAERDSLESWQPLSATFDFPNTEPRITEDGQDRITEAGDARVLES